MNARVLLFPALLAADACRGISMTDPSVKQCRDEIEVIVMTFPDGRTVHDTVTIHADTTTCRKAA